jgi:hypothetical protein
VSAPEFDGQPMTKREVLIARRAFESGVHWMYGRECVLPSAWPGDERMSRAASDCYPLPKVTRPRVARDPRGIGSWGAKKFADTLAIHYVGESDGAWSPEFRHFLATPERVALWADLLANPTEEVEA